MKKRKKGYSLIMVISIFTVLVIIGTALLSLTLMNYKKRKAEAVITKSKYYSEAGLDEAYAIILKYIDKAMVQGDNEVAENMDTIWAAVDKERNVPGTTLDYTDGNKNVDQAKVDKKKASVYKAAYKRYVEDNRTNLEADLEDQSKYDITNDELIKASDRNKPVITVDSLSDATFGSDNKLKLILTSTFQHHNMDKGHVGKFEKKIQANFIIEVPDYMKKVHTAKKNVIIKKNPTWTKALCAEKNLTLNGGQLNVNNGDVFIGGNDTTPGVTNNKGIIIKDQASKIKMTTGDLITPENVVFDFNGSSTTTEDNVLIDTGNIYAKNILVNENSNGSQLVLKKGSDNKKGSVFLLDDLEMNASRTNVNIGGSFYGLQDGSQATSYGKPDSSSSIIINASDLGASLGTSLSIGDKAYIYGSSYIAMDNNYKYQTGESISVKGHYKAYTEHLKSNVNVSTGDDAKNLKDDLNFDYMSPLTLISNFKEPDVVIKDLTTKKIHVYAGDLDLSNVKSFVLTTNNNIYSETAIDADLTLKSINESVTEGEKVTLQLINNDNTSKTYKNIPLRGDIKVDIKGAITADDKTKILINLNEYSGTIPDYIPVIKYAVIVDGKSIATAFLGDEIDLNRKLYDGDTCQIRLLDSKDNAVGSDQTVHFHKKQVPTVLDKSDYFYAYTQQYEGNTYFDKNLVKAGIIIGNVAKSIHSGSIFNTSADVVKTNYNSGSEDFLLPKIAQLKDKLYYMDYAENGLTSSIKDIDTIEKKGERNTNDNYDDIEARTNSVFTVDNCVEVSTINDNIASDGVDDNNSGTYTIKSDYAENKKNMYFINKNGSDSIAIVGSEVSDSDVNSLLPNGCKRINLNNATKGLIISEGDIYLVGDINFTGSIISKGNIIKKQGTATINYSELELIDLITRKYDVLKDVFKNSMITSNKYDFNAKVYETQQTNSSDVVRIKDWLLLK